MSAGLLSRIAETLFWTGRYVERADDTARMVDVYVHRMLEESPTGQDGSCRALLAVLGMPPGTDSPLDIGVVLDRLAYDAADPSSIAGAVLAARRSARGAREVISSEMWECLNLTQHELPAQRQAAGHLGPSVYLRFVRERAALFFGLADATMSRDDAWRFLVLGRSVERVDMTTRLLSGRLSAASDDLGPSMLLRACGAHEAYLRTRGWPAAPHQVHEFLLVDRLFPRSVLHVLATAEECLAALGPGPVRTGMGDAARRPIGRLRTRLEYTDPQSLPEQLPDLLTSLRLACREATDAIAERYFTCEQPLAWEHGG